MLAQIPPSLLFPQFRLHWLVSGLYKRRPTPSMWPAGPLTSNSKRLARPFQTLLTTEGPPYSTHCFEAVKGCTSRETWVFQVPKLKSKSCWPSRFFGDCSGSAALASDATISARHKRHGRKYLSKTLFDNGGSRGIGLGVE